VTCSATPRSTAHHGFVLCLLSSEYFIPIGLLLVIPMYTDFNNESLHGASVQSYVDRS